LIDQQIEQLLEDIAQHQHHAKDDDREECGHEELAANVSVEKSQGTKLPVDPRKRQAWRGASLMAKPLAKRQPAISRTSRIR
jgi:hypothetical protein